MKSKNCYSGVNPIIVQQIRFHARKLKQHKCFAHEDIEDIEQELLCEIWSYLDQYDENRGAFSTFITRLVQCRANNLLHKQLCMKNAITGYISNISDDIPDTRSFTREIVMRIDVEDITAKLPKKWQDLCEQLKFFNLVEIASMNNMSRTTLYGIVRKMRIRFLPLYKKK